MLEIHYYFTPILDHLERFDQNDWHLHPIVTLPAAKELRDVEDLPKNVASLNACHDRLQKISLDYLTVTLYGRKQGRLFLLLLQDCLSEITVLEYTDQIRQKILKKLNISTSDFMEYRQFAKRHLSLDLKDFRENDFHASPSSLVITDKECLHMEKCSHLALQDYLYQIEKTA
ncbi:DsbA family protein [Lactococcus allomyrinae]|uniref:Dithiol-disulfide isomerase n=1 Tax=Lactococcus allomyrinae TaxID=2419773 RepID=A0A387BHM3_9LACT|nr:DsbA family protein [Lactococcus allomyrinae]AYG01764.1 dithiol-disulfide isomerase [Lactococcus allomyrinae]